MRELDRNWLIIIAAIMILIIHHQDITIVGTTIVIITGTEIVLIEETMATIIIIKTIIIIIIEVEVVVGTIIAIIMIVGVMLVIIVEMYRDMIIAATGEKNLNMIKIKEVIIISIQIMKRIIRKMIKKISYRHYLLILNKIKIRKMLGKVKKKKNNNKRKKDIVDKLNLQRIRRKNHVLEIR